MIYFIPTSLILIFFLVKWNIKLSNIVRHDTTMFKVSCLRGEIVKFLQNKWDTISPTDGQHAINLIEQCDFAIKHHKKFYKLSFKVENAKELLINQKKDVDEAESYIDKIHNKSIKLMYARFGLILLENIKAYTRFLKIRLLFIILKWLAWALFSTSLKRNKDRLNSFLSWLDIRDSEFSSYNQKLQMRKRLIRMN